MVSSWPGAMSGILLVSFEKDNGPFGKGVIRPISAAFPSMPLIITDKSRHSRGFIGDYYCYVFLFLKYINTTLSFTFPRITDKYTVGIEGRMEGDSKL
jgi:hypothetical protein